MTLHVTNTLTGEREPFEPQDPEDVLLYYCGLTVSDPPHLGHARSWVHVDVMHRWLEYLGYDVRHVENFTDVNEKIVARVGEDDLGADELDVAETYIERTLADMRSLNLLRAEVYPRVSEHVPEIVDLVETLIEKGYAYESNGSVYFDVTSFDDYGKLSNQELEEIESQGDPDERSEKRHPADFALWKAGGVDETAVHEHRHEGVELEGEDEPPAGQTWDSPWGEGRPGWHIECSAMSMSHLGDTLDIHVGGRDLVFPHHENEIAQSEAATDRAFANYWLHCELFQMDDEKMSSSLGNFVTVDQAVDQWGTNVVRTFLTAGSYNSTQLYSDETIAEAEERWAQLERAYDAAVETLDSTTARTKVEAESLRTAVADARESFVAAMNDDFNTREAQSALLSIATAVNAHLESETTEGSALASDAGGQPGSSTAEAGYDYRGLRRAVETLEEFGGVLGLSFADETTGSAELAGDVVELVLDVRERERADGNYDRADELRDELEALGLEVQDTDEGPTYRL